MAAPGWPATLTDGAVALRPLKMRDGPAWMESRKHNVEWLSRWEATPPGGPSEVGTSATIFAAMTRRLRQDARQGYAMPFTITHAGEFAGQLTVSGIVRGSLHSGHIGYWVDRRVAGRGVMPTAVALVVDHCFRVAGLHRVEVNIRPENAASLRVVEKLGFRPEGTRERYLHIAGDWRDHLTFALVRDDVPGGLLTRWHASRAAMVRDTPS